MFTSWVLKAEEEQNETCGRRGRGDKRSQLGFASQKACCKQCVPGLHRGIRSQEMPACSLLSPSGKEMGRVRAAMPASLRLLHNAVHHKPAHAG